MQRFVTATFMLWFGYNVTTGGKPALPVPGHRDGTLMNPGSLSRVRKELQ